DLKRLNFGERVAELAKKFIGTQYDWGGRSFNGIDCSGLSSVVYKTLGMEIPRNAKDQYISAKKLKRFSELKKGDLVFSTKENSDFVDHVMIYSGDGKIIEATKDSNNVREILFAEKFGEKIENMESGRKIKGKKIYFGSFLKEEKSDKRRKK
ncbi:MAG: C40 family peptidase, partial [Elusimicrobiales bacterium]